MNSGSESETGKPLGPFDNGEQGVRDARGRFLPGNPGGPGNPHAKKTAEIRSAVLEATSPEDIREIFAALLERAKQGDVIAAREVFDRLLGKARQGVDIGLELPTLKMYGKDAPVDET